VWRTEVRLRMRRSFEEKVVKGLGLVEAQGAELLWYCEGDHEVRDS
jgi:hypothetical protein